MKEPVNLPGELCDDPREQDENEDALRFVEENCTVPDYVFLPNTGRRCFLSAGCDPENGVCVCKEKV